MLQRELGQRRPMTNAVEPIPVSALEGSTVDRFAAIADRFSARLAIKMAPAPSPIASLRRSSMTLRPRPLPRPSHGPARSPSCSPMRRVFRLPFSACWRRGVPASRSMPTIRSSETDRLPRAPRRPPWCRQAISRVRRARCFRIYPLSISKRCATSRARSRAGGRDRTISRTSSIRQGRPVARRALSKSPRSSARHSAMRGYTAPELRRSHRLVTHRPSAADSHHGQCASQWLVPAHPAAARPHARWLGASDPRPRHYDFSIGSGAVPPCGRGARRKRTARWLAARRAGRGSGRLERFRPVQARLSAKRPFRRSSRCDGMFHDLFGMVCR